MCLSPVGFDFNQFHASYSADLVVSWSRMLETLQNEIEFHKFEEQMYPKMKFTTFHLFNTIKRK